jgi:DNA-directed RNA polymerase subunit RPC12/RpoP
MRARYKCVICGAVRFAFELVTDNKNGTRCAHHNVRQ